MSKEDLFIREATPVDLPEVVNLYSSLETEHSSETSSFEPIELFHKMKLYPYHKLFVADKNSKIVGTFTLTIIGYLCHYGKKAGVMEAVVVDPTLRSQGIGKQMVAFALQQCRENNCYKMALSSNIIREKAHVFYEREGFRLHGYSLYTDLPVHSSVRRSNDTV